MPSTSRFEHAKRGAVLRTLLGFDLSDVRKRLQVLREFSNVILRDDDQEYRLHVATY